ncbi:CZB domain-containing protein [Candidatus Symbiobacter mobilis]|nr:CZB domain-containing protein [Candidatus Symbiobacter mobilis]
MSANDFTHPIDKAQRVQAAIESHFAWFDRIKQTITSGTSEFTPAEVAVTETCDLGHWLQESFRSYCPDPAVMAAIERVHHEFHLRASAALDIALRGDNSTACRAIALGSELSNLSGKLVVLLRSM